MNRNNLGIRLRLGRMPLLGTVAAVMLGLSLAPLPLAAQAPSPGAPPIATGPAVGQKIPDFRATDQNGKTQDFNSIKGPQGAILYFNRSADW